MSIGIICFPRLTEERIARDLHTEFGQELEKQAQIRLVRAESASSPASFLQSLQELPDSSNASYSLKGTDDLRCKSVCFAEKPIFFIEIDEMFLKLGACGYIFSSKCYEMVSKVGSLRVQIRNRRCF